MILYLSLQKMIMITEQYKDTVYFSNLFARHYPEVYKELSNILSRHHVPHGTLMHTKDYWCRDYMPVQLGYDAYIQFRYEPDYLAGKPQYKTDVAPVLKAMRKKLNVRQSPLVMDGGNIVVCERTPEWITPYARDWKPVVVMTEKVFQENAEIKPEKLLAMLKEDSYNKDYLFLPWDKSDICGHTDGIIHNVGDGKVLVNLSIYPKKTAQEMRRRLNEVFEVVDLKLSKYDNNSWAYINMLQTRDIIIVPGLGLSTDREALEQIKELHPSYQDRVYQVNIGAIVEKWGGALNCLSWTMSRDLSRLHHNEISDKRFAELILKANEQPYNYSVLSHDEVQFLGEYNAARLGKESNWIDNLYWGF